MNRPFIYIAALRRTGSTVLSEALTLLPHAFIFREPGFGRNNFSLKHDDAERFRELGIDLMSYRRTWLAQKDQRPVLTALQEDFLPRVGEIMQLGVKEIRHTGWENYHAAFPEMKAIITGRDPRDIYISLYHRWQAGKGSWKGPYTPERVAADLNAEFENQRKISMAVAALPVRYEDLCAKKEIIQQIKNFINSPITEIGDIGGFLGKDKGRMGEHDIHGNRITSARVARWRREKNEKLSQEATEIMDLMAEYCDYWGYKK